MSWIQTLYITPRVTKHFCLLPVRSLQSPCRASKLYLASSKTEALWDQVKKNTLWSGTQSLPHSRLCFSLTHAMSCHPEEAMFLMLVSLSYHGLHVVLRLSLHLYAQIVLLACRKFIIICHLLKADTKLTVEGDRTKETAQTLHTLLHEGQ